MRRTFWCWFQVSSLVKDCYSLLIMWDFSKWNCFLLITVWFTCIHLLQLRYLGAFSGRSAAEETRRIMEEAFTNELAMQFNLSGKGKLGRKAFAKLRLYKVVIGNYQNSICGETNAYSHPPDYIYTFVYLNVQPDHVQRTSCQIKCSTVRN